MVKHHFIANISIHDYYSASKFEQDVLVLLDNLFQKHDIVVMTGGSGLYVNAVCKGIDDVPDPDEKVRTYVDSLFEQAGVEHLQVMLKILDPEFYEEIDLQNHKRLRRAVEVCLQTGKAYSSLRTNAQKQRPFNVVRTALNRDKEEVNARINARVDLMIEGGLIDEAKILYQYRHLNALNTVGYKEIFAYLDGKIPLEQAILDIKTNTRRYARKQLTWLRRENDMEWTQLSTI